MSVDLEYASADERSPPPPVEVVENAVQEEEAQPALSDLAGLQATARQLQQALLGQPFCRGGRTYSLASRLGVTAVRPALAAAALIDEVVEASAQARAGKGESIVIAAVTQTPQHADGPAWLMPDGELGTYRVAADVDDRTNAVIEERPDGVHLWLGHTTRLHRRR